MGRRFGLAAAICLVLVGCAITGTSSSGIGFPAGPSLAQFGLQERCGQREGGCTERAMEAIESALERLGQQMEDTPITTNGSDTPPPEDRLYIQVTYDPMHEWQSSAGPASTGGAFMFDLTDDNPYAVVAPDQAFRLSAEDAAAIRNALFVER